MALNGRVAAVWTPTLVQRGWVPVTRAFLEAYPRLHITASEALLLINLLAYKGRKEHAHPSIATLARRLGVEPRTVRNLARKLENRGLLQRIIRRQGHGRAQTNLWDLSPLFQRLEELEYERR